MISIDTNKLLFINKMTSVEKERWFLNGVYFGLDNLIAGTDGHVLGELKNAFSGEIEKPFILHLDKKSLKAIKDSKAKYLTIDVNLEEFKANITAEFLNITVEIIDGVFPDYKKQIPQVKESSCCQIGFNPRLMSLFCGYTKDDVIEIYINERDEELDRPSAILVKNTALKDDFTGAIMPCRIVDNFYGKSER